MSREKLMDRIAKLLKLADASRNTSEAEASAAAAKVQELLQEHGLSLAEIEAAGDSSAKSDREKREVDGYAINHPWQVKLMEAIAETNFCLCRVTTKKTQRGNSKRFQLVGRKLNVEATKMVYEYLFETMRRLALEQGFVTKDFADGKKDNKSHLDRKIWNEGCTDRLVARLKERAAQAMRESEARKHKAAGNGTGRELVLSDVYGSEADLNNDEINGFPSGTTAAKRRENEERSARIKARHEKLMADGVERIEAWYVANGYDHANAKRFAASYHQEQARPQRRSGGRSGGTNWTSWSKKKERINSEAYQAGSRTGSKIGLDPQAGYKETKKIEGDK